MNTGMCLNWKCSKEGIDKKKFGSFFHFNEYTSLFCALSDPTLFFLYFFQHNAVRAQCETPGGTKSSQKLNKYDVHCKGREGN